MFIIRRAANPCPALGGDVSPIPPGVAALIIRGIAIQTNNIWALLIVYVPLYCMHHSVYCIECIGVLFSVEHLALYKSYSELTVLYKLYSV